VVVTDAMAVLLLVHVPPVGVPDNVIEAPIHTVDGPPIDALAVMVTSLVTKLAPTV
jgi:hypothetical protein